MIERVGLWALLALSVAVWGAQIASPFQYDDWNVIVEAPGVHSFGAWWETMPGIRPLLKLSYALDFELATLLTGGPQSGDFVKFFHATNLLLHLVNVGLVWALLYRWPGLSNQPLGIWLATAVFALHPVQGEVAIYVSGRSMSLMAMFLLISLHCESRRAVMAGDQRGRKVWRTAGLVAFVAALAVRETAIMYPLLLWFWRWKPDRIAPLARSSADRLWHYWVVAGMAALAMIALPRYRALLEFSWALRSPSDQIGMLIDALAHLWCRSLLMMQASIDPMPAPVNDPLAILVLIGFLVASLVGGIRLLDRSPLHGVALLWPWLFLLPVYSLVPRLDPVADRHWYLALLGPAVLLASVVVRLPRALATMSTASCVGLIALAGAGRAADYSSETALWRAATHQAPNSPRAWNNLGLARAIEGDRTGALDAYRQALAIDPGYRRAAVNLLLLHQKGESSAGR